MTGLNHYIQLMFRQPPAIHSLTVMAHLWNVQIDGASSETTKGNCSITGTTIAFSDFQSNAAVGIVLTLYRYILYAVVDISLVSMCFIFTYNFITLMLVNRKF
jgi:hypothetical protein